MDKELADKIKKILYQKVELLVEEEIDENTNFCKRKIIEQEINMLLRVLSSLRY